MYPQELLETLFDQDTLTYLIRKNMGGSNSEKGQTYENCFAVYQIAQRAIAFIEQGKDIQLASQIRAFVDDLILLDTQAPQAIHFQLKNSQTVFWGKGLGTIADDFEKQHQLNQACSQPCELMLVVSNPTLGDRLLRSIPSQIQPFSRVIHFPYAPTLLRIIQQEPQFRNALAYLSVYEEPTLDAIDAIATVLLGAWVSSDRTNITLSEVLTKAQQCQPSFIRSFSKEEPTLDVEVITILNRIENFTYTLEKGFFSWKYQGGLEQGTLLYSCETESFRRFQDYIKRNVPTSFEELEGLLL